MRKYTVLVIISLCLFISKTASADVYTFRSYQEYEVNDEFELTVSNTSGTTTIERSQTEFLIIDVEKKISASSKEDAEKLENEIEIDIEARKNRVEIETRYPDWNMGDSFWEKLFDLRKDNFGSVDYFIKIPAKVQLLVSSTSGSVRLFNLDGSIELAITSGDVKIKDCTADVNISSTSGDVDLSGVEGNVKIGSTSSDMLIENVTGALTLRATSGVSEIYGLTGNLTLRKTSGDTRILDIIGNVDISATSGDIQLEQEEGSIRINSHSGDVAVDTKLLSGGRYAVETISGSIEFSVPPGSDGRVKLQSVSGTIDTSLPLTIESFSRRKLTGVLGLGGPRIELSSTSGDVTLGEY
jgi:predicted membrane protein